MPKKKSVWERAGIVGVDSGMIHIGDPCYLSKGGPYGSWKGFCDELRASQDYKDRGIKQLNYAKGPPGLGVVMTSGYGDGRYEVLVRRDSEGTIVEARIKFDRYAR